MRFSIIFLTFFTAGPALSHGNHLLPAGSHDDGAGLIVLPLAMTGLLAWVLKRTRPSRTGDDG